MKINNIKLISRPLVTVLRDIIHFLKYKLYQNRCENSKYQNCHVPYAHSKTQTLIYHDILDLY